MAIAVLLLYLAAVIAIGYYMKSKVQNEMDYLAAGGKLGVWVGGATLAATQMSAGTAIGAVGFHYQVGYNYAWIWPAIWASWMVMALFIAPKMKAFFNSNIALTIPDLLGTRYESSAIRAGYLCFDINDLLWDDDCSGVGWRLLNISNLSAAKTTKPPSIGPLTPSKQPPADTKHLRFRTRSQGCKRKLRTWSFLVVLKDCI